MSRLKTGETPRQAAGALIVKELFGTHYDVLRYPESYDLTHNQARLVAGYIAKVHDELLAKFKLDGVALTKSAN